MAARCVLLPPRGLTLGSSTSTHSFAGSAALMKRSRSILRYIRCQYWCLLLLCVHCRPTLAPDGSGLGIYACSLIIYASPSFSSSFLTLLPPFPPSFHPSISLSFPPSHPPCFPLLFYLSFSPPPPPDPPPFLTLFPHSLWTTPPPPCTFMVVGLWRPWSLLPLAHSLLQRFIFTASSLKRLLHGCQN